ncbi:spore coat protein S [Clostridium tepidiprofundi DSM 19306]|uniref:Spore coat protein S n=1 Tax=Clostridium tepidiprofundi DSM 19306 TaxID=1121338 RepID=A0A151B4V6_9CLOT|nr:CotS family spore coat protein [Clostridium tepidiprofundi]KYH34951.1 spore coat protein S [Clostridium tepidiprofundi DSM 19306]
MNSSKYKCREYLNLYDLDIELFKRFNLYVYDVVPVRKVFILRTDKGDKILKKIDYSIDDLRFIYTAMEYLKNNGFDRVINFIKTTEGYIYTIWNGEIYCIMDLLEGRECEYSNPVDIAITSRALGNMHKASSGFEYNIKSRYNLHKIIDNFERKLHKIMFFKEMVLLYDNTSKFDEIFLENVDYYIKQMNESLRILEHSKYHELCSEEDKIVLCHHDLAHHNILIKDEEAYFIDFDYSVLDLRVHDLCNFINKVIKNFAYDMEKTNQIIANYNNFDNLDNREMEVLYGMLYFPEDFYSICVNYYDTRKNWSEDIFIRRLIKKVDYKQDREEFLNNLA